MNRTKAWKETNEPIKTVRNWNEPNKSARKGRLTD